MAPDGAAAAASTHTAPSTTRASTDNGGGAVPLRGTSRVRFEMPEVGSGPAALWVQQGGWRHLSGRGTLWGTLLYYARAAGTVHCGASSTCVCKYWDRCSGCLLAVAAHGSRRRLCELSAGAGQLTPVGAMRIQPTLREPGHMLHAVCR